MGLLLQSVKLLQVREALTHNKHNVPSIMDQKLIANVLHMSGG